jgi:transcriptional regulator with XRE-family HTH domain
MTNIKNQIGKKIRAIREANCFSQEDLAEKAGLHRTYIGSIERGERNITIESLEKIAEALQINIKDLFEL